MRLPMASPLVALALLATVAACGGGGGGSVPRQNGASGSAAFTIAVPAATRSQAKHPAYISPNAQALSITIVSAANPAGVPAFSESVQLASSPQCTAGSSGTTCTITVTLAPASYLATISVYGSGSALLSQGQNLPFSITAGQTSAVDLTLNGIPASLQLTTSAAFTGSTASGYTMNGPGTVTVTALDASGATIVGPGSPALGMTSSNTAFSIADSGNVFTITPPSSPQSTQISVTATLPGASAPAMTLTFGLASSSATPPPSAAPTISPSTAPTITPSVPPTTTPSPIPSPMLFVSNQGNNTISVYALPVIGAPAPVMVISNGVSLPTRLAVDAAGDLFAGEFNSNSVSEWVPPYTGAPVSFGSALINGPQWLVTDPLGRVVVTNYSGTTDLVFAPPFGTSSTPVATLQTGAGPQSLAVDGSGDIFSGNFGTNSVEVFAPPLSGVLTPGATLLNPSGSTLLHPWGIAIDAAGNAWVAWEQSGVSAPVSIAEYLAPFSVSMTPSVVLTSGISDPEAIAVVDTAGPSQGDVFVANYSANNVVMYTPITGGYAPAAAFAPAGVGGNSLPVVLPGTNSGPQGLYVDPQGNLYVADAGTNTVNVYVPPYNSSGNPVATISSGISGPIGFASFP